jgi:hypothetical protein
VRFCQRDEQSRVIVRPTFQIVLQVNFGSGVKIYHAPAVALAENHTFALVKINVPAGEPHKFFAGITAGAEKSFSR